MKTGYPLLIFLDFDGVLNSLGLEPSMSLVLDRGSVERLNRLIGAISAKDGQQPRIVISSAWRLAPWPRLLIHRLVQAGFKYSKCVIGATPEGVSRQNEIERFLTQAGWPLDRAIILDDERNLGRLAKRHIRTDPKIGLTEKDVARAVRLLDVAL